MTIVRFATLCDKCKKRSEEYSSWPTCLECGDDVCTTCQVPGSATEDERHQALCKACDSELKECVDCGHELLGAPCGKYGHVCCPTCENRCMLCEELEAKVRMDVEDDQ